MEGGQVSSFFGIEVKTCPHCGKGGRVKVWTNKYGFLRSCVTCDGCGMETKTFCRERTTDSSDFGFIADAIGSWNARAE